jgi:hypothetical protein
MLLEQAPSSSPLSNLRFSASSLPFEFHALDLVLLLPPLPPITFNK